MVHMESPGASEVDLQASGVHGCTETLQHACNRSVLELELYRYLYYLQEGHGAEEPCYYTNRLGGHINMAIHLRSRQTSPCTFTRPSQPE